MPTRKLGLLGQSNVANLSATAIASLIAQVYALTGYTLEVTNFAVAGTGLLKSTMANTSTPNAYWLGEENPNAPIQALLAAPPCDLLMWVQGECDASVGVSKKDYRSGLVQLHTIIARNQHKSRDELPLLVSPLGNGSRVYVPGGLQVRDAQIEAIAEEPGMYAGPEYHDLPVNTTETPAIHMTTEAKEGAFIARMAACIAKAIGLAPVAVAGSNVARGEFTLDLSSAADQTVTLPFQPKAVLLIGCVNGTAAMSIGVDDGSARRNICDISRDDASVVDCYGTNPAAMCFLVSHGNVFSFSLSMNANGFTIVKARTGNPTGTATITFVANG